MTRPDATMLTFVMCVLIYGVSMIAAGSSATDDDLRLQLLSERRDMAFDFTIYNDSSNFAYRKTNITICVQHSLRISTINKYVFSFYRDANPGIRATVLLVVRVDETEQRLYTLTKIREAIVMAAVNDTDWVVKASDITVNPILYISATATRNVIQGKWNPYEDPKPKDGKYNPYSSTEKPTATPYQLDQVTRSRNALLLSLIVFVLAFLTAFIALMVFMPKALPATTTVAPRFDRPLHPPGMNVLKERTKDVTLMPSLLVLKKPGLYLVPGAKGSPGFFLGNL
ncbi:hypothetical protein LSH36_1020g00047 [Paralvinella palmiformis]|uniref:Uncharacterized protein n=1 Tax=Paralvinella palmiformis TaxID=53620 RepID=A0AAD9MRX6_9ANNE|nr:hypothetical protein LSH36_1020g00047 [Paralvinella palmiformis]